MDDEWNKKQAGQEVESWLKQLKSTGGFGVHPEILAYANQDFESERVSDEQTKEIIKEFYSGASQNGGYILDPHSAVGVAAALRSIQRASPDETHHISLSTAHPAKFANAVQLALQDDKAFDFSAVLPEEFVGLESKERRVTDVEKDAGLEGIRKIVMEQVAEELKDAH